MEIGRYYLNRKDFIGAINRFKIVVTQYQTTRHVEEALMRLTEAYMALGVVSEAQTAAAVLGPQFPGQPLVRRRLPAGEGRRASSRPRTRAPGSAAPSPSIKSPFAGISKS